MYVVNFFWIWLKKVIGVIYKEFLERLIFYDFYLVKFLKYENIVVFFKCKWNFIYIIWVL